MKTDIIFQILKTSEGKDRVYRSCERHLLKNMKSYCRATTFRCPDCVCFGKFPADLESMKQNNIKLITVNQRIMILLDEIKL